MNTTLWRTLAAQTRLGVPVPQALDRLASREPQAARLAEALHRGSSLAQAVEREALPAPVVAAVRVAEAAGDLPRGLDELATIVEESAARDAAWRVALAYPQLLATVTVGLCLGVGWMFCVCNQTLGHLTATPPPGLTGVLVGVMRLIWTPATALTAIGLLLVLHGALRIEAVRLRLPSVGDWLMCLQMVTWLRWLDWLTSRGIALPEAVHTAAGACTSPLARAALQRVATRVEHGTSLTDALAREPLVPRFVGWLVGHAEGAEFRQHLLARTASAVERDARATEESFFPLAEHFLVGAMGLLTACVVLSFYLEFTFVLWWW